MKQSEMRQNFLGKEKRNAGCFQLRLVPSERSRSANFQEISIDEQIPDRRKMATKRGSQEEKSSAKYETGQKINDGKNIGVEKQRGIRG